ncbi:bifunctional adenosylcobinamide kinase/adenosylcobinamide-phosphate guanylyltransferase [Vreelandella neptunia]|jgi:adenosylcobinamide kinase / adenosylcobinamide-phosphate guanylyltransferase|uniref:Bifunctional adenosylcobalamin biosynthesis protein n=1 Tax=Vreelandella neptunia TaxID=115551 RepID=A0ABZ0YG68_9GAMM|nr:bifunctional adenosylcobinamide kinase/adenosylcobinamide-phosphate guanylyltransferase [Halomonas neptunia]MDN3560092.1 bifunctional adenosylcobinamide kinase/adenosylcobinamide-phosphate guanylyltransferase [Halomonas neptunia]TDV94469.1 adenosylcobinamide kinase /adenosylcobinamide-phosphate guanylyltransferase [Halomonas alkaliantarctica]WQH10868.1 bifunctional adenosylcobinamide kinase/adenosylcobinamide-phosphate guanylyltransferase [Halomonas neptunia]
MIVFVSGGARSGKSDIAEQWVVDAAASSPCYYLATAEVYDEEMAERVARHQQTRNGQSETVQWITIEAPLAIDQALVEVPDGSAVLLDCVTLWASQVLYASRLCEEEGLALLANALAEARARSLYLVIVSNDINEALPPTDAETWRYLAFLQRAHCWIAAEADSVLEVVAGCAIKWKHQDWKHEKEVNV